MQLHGGVASYWMLTFLLMPLALILTTIMLFDLSHEQFIISAQMGNLYTYASYLLFREEWLDLFVRLIPWLYHNVRKEFSRIGSNEKIQHVGGLDCGLWRL
jgi:hypothetical protein